MSDLKLSDVSLRYVAYTVIPLAVEEQVDFHLLVNLLKVANLKARSISSVLLLKDLPMDEYLFPTDFQEKDFFLFPNLLEKLFFECIIYKDNGVLKIAPHFIKLFKKAAKSQIRLLQQEIEAEAYRNNLKLTHKDTILSSEELLEKKKREEYCKITGIPIQAMEFAMANTTSSTTITSSCFILNNERVTQY